MTPAPFTPESFHAARRFAPLAAGRIAYVECGSGPAALFVHGFPLNGYHWRHAMAGLADMRRCIAPDLMGLGYSEVGAGQDLSFAAQARMLVALLDSLGIAEVDLIGNDSATAIAQLIAVAAPERVRSLTLTNGDTHDNYPPKAFKTSHELAHQGRLGSTLAMLLANPDAALSPAAMGGVYEHPERLLPDTLKVYLDPLAATPERQRLVDRYINQLDCRATLAIHADLKRLQVPTLVAWGDADPFFPADWAHWLGRTIPGVRKVELLLGAKLFFPEERAAAFCALLREHWQTTPA